MKNRNSSTGGKWWIVVSRISIFKTPAIIIETSSLNLTKVYIGELKPWGLFVNWVNINKRIIMKNCARIHKQTDTERNSNSGTVTLADPKCWGSITNKTMHNYNLFYKRQLPFFFFSLVQFIWKNIQSGYKWLFIFNFCKDKACLFYNIIMIIYRKIH